jgi:putative heme iron utilization protein
MDADTAAVLGTLIRGRSVAALATLHGGDPFASMIPYAISAGGTPARLRFVTHVSRLSAHTRDMLAEPRVCLLIMAVESAAVPPQALPRVSVPCVATFVPPEHSDHEPLRAAYLERFPHAADYFLLGDFSLVALEPQSARFIAGFARALTLSPADLTAAVAAAG